DRDPSGRDRDRRGQHGVGRGPRRTADRRLRRPALHREPATGRAAFDRNGGTSMHGTPSRADRDGRRRPARGAALRGPAMIRTCPPLAALLLALAFVVWPSKAEANVNCRIDTMAINFGASASGTGSVSFTCTSFNGSSGPVTICSQLGTPSFPGTTQQPRSEERRVGKEGRARARQSDR